MNEQSLGNNLITCKFCGITTDTNIARSCTECFNSKFEQDTASEASVSKILGITIPKLHLLEEDGRLTPVQYNMSDFYKAGSKVINRYSRQSVIEFIKETSVCRRCKSNYIYRGIYCSECSEGLISINEAAKILDISVARFTILKKKYPDRIIQYPDKSRVKYYKRAIQDLKYNQPKEVIPEQIKWSHFFLKCKKCKTTDFPHVESGYCSQCYIPVPIRWSERYTRCRKCKTIDQEHAIAGLCRSCYENSNYYLVPKYYKDGLTYQEIGDELKISRERARQILKKVSQSSIAEKSEGVAKGISSLKKESKRKRVYDEWYPKIDKYHLRYLSVARGYYSINRFCVEQSIPLTARFVIEENFPDIFEVISERKERWSWSYDYCLMCKTTELSHKAHGYCEKCYPKSDVWKARQKVSYLKNREKRLAYNREFSKKYYSREDIKLKQQKKQDLYYYDGNREKALVRDKYLCAQCGIDRKTSYERHGVGFRVRHIDNDRSNNDLDNLLTLCSSCFSKNIWKSRHPK